MFYFIDIFFLQGKVEEGKIWVEGLWGRFVQKLIEGRGLGLKLDWIGVILGNGVFISFRFLLNRGHR